MAKTVRKHEIMHVMPLILLDAMKLSKLYFNSFVLPDRIVPYQCQKQICHNTNDTIATVVFKQVPNTLKAELLSFAQLQTAIAVAS